MAAVNDLCRLLDNNWLVILKRNDLNSYTAVAVAEGEQISDAVEKDQQITDDFTPELALCRLSEKMIGNVVGEM